jgi:hypothetical protein
MRNQRTGKGWMVIKIDLEKAYDRLKRSFINETLTNIELPQQFIDITLQFISNSPSMRILWNGEALEEFHPSIGIRRENPFSLYLLSCILRDFST